MTQTLTLTFIASVIASIAFIGGMATEREAWRAKPVECVNMILTVPGAGIFRADGARVLEIGK